MHYLYSHRVWEKEEERERPRLSTRGHNHCFGIVVIEFTFVPCHPGFDVINTRMCGEERSGICFGIVVTEFKFVCRPYFHVVNTRVYEEEDI